MKVHLMCGIKSNIVTSVEITGRYSHDSPQFKPLVKTTARNFTMQDVDADSAYSRRDNLELVANYGAAPYIPFKISCAEGAPPRMKTDYTCRGTVPVKGRI